MRDQSAPGERAAPDAPARAGRFSLKRLAPLIAVVAAIVLVFAMGWHRYLSLDVIARNRAALQELVATQPLVAAAAYVLLYAATVVLSLPIALLLTLLGGFLFGVLVGGTLTVAAATLGATLVFLLARSALGEPLRARAGPQLARLANGFREDALNYMLFLRLAPVFPFWLVNLAPAFLGVPLRVYVIGTFFGIMPGTFAYAFLGAGLDSIIVAQREAYDACVAARAPDEPPCEFAFDPSAVVTWQIIASLVALGLAALIPIYLKRRRRARTR